MLAVCIAVGSSGVARAACNAIPASVAWYPSERGSVSQPIAAPGDTVAIRLDAACPNQKRDFSATDSVELVFDSALGGEVAIAVTPSSVAPRELALVIPDTVDAANARPNGLAGPARIVVTAADGTRVAKVKALYEPTSSCDLEPETTFERFTVLPKPNDVASATSLRATVDGGDNILIPLDHSNVVPGGSAQPLAVFEHGAGLFRNFQGGAIKLREAVAAAIAAGASPTDLVRSYTLRGQLLPALALFDRKGAVFGTADVAYGAVPGTRSVLRISRRAGSTQIYNALHLLGGSGAERGTHPMVLRRNGSPQDVSVTACPQTIELLGLRTAAGAIAYPRGNVGSGAGEVQVHDAPRGGQSCGSNTKKQVARSGPAGRPVLEAGGNLAAFAQTRAPSPPALRVYGGDGGDRSPTVLGPAPAMAALFGEHSLAISASRVFLGSGSAPVELRAFDAASKSFLPGAQTPMVRATLAGAGAAAVTPAGELLLYDPSTDQLSPPLASGVDRVAASSQMMAYTTAAPAASASSASGPLWVQPLPGAGLSSAIPSPVGVRAREVAVDGTSVVFTTPEAAEPATAPGCMPATPSGCDLNGDGDAGDAVLRLYAAGLSSPGYPARDFVARDGWVAFRSPEHEQGKLDPLCGATSAGACDRNGDGDANDDVMLLWERTTGIVYSTGRAALRCDGTCAALGLEWMRPYAIRDGHVFFLSNELEQNDDLDGDGAVGNVDVLQVFDLESRAIWSVAPMVAAGTALLPLSQSLDQDQPFLRLVPQAIPAAAAGIAAAASDETFCAAREDETAAPCGARRPAEEKPPPPLRRALSQGAVIGDRDRDGTFDAFDSCAALPNPEQLDDDCDGLGDRTCDPTYCSAFVPSLPDGRIATPPRGLAESAVRYAERRGWATALCLLGLARGRIAGPAEPLCRGYFVDGVEVLPLEPAANEAVRAAGADLWVTAGRARRRRDADAVERVRRVAQAFGESANAVSRAAWGAPVAVEREAIACQKAIGSAAVEYLAEATSAMQDCLEERRVDAAAECIGSLRDERIVPPANGRARARLEVAAANLRAAAESEPCRAGLAALDACADDPEGAAHCIECVGWRRAADAVLSLLQPLDDPQPCAAARAPLGIAAGRSGASRRTPDTSAP